jgi:hypothetical protein
MRVDGACHCGNIRYEAEVDPANVGLCHCTDCQALTGSAFSMFAPVPKATFRLTAAQPRIYVKTADSGSRRAQAFCPECGSRIYAAAESDPQVFNLRVGTMRQRAALAPAVQFWCRSALPWVSRLQSLPQLPTQPGPSP